MNGWRRLWVVACFFIASAWVCLALKALNHLARLFMDYADLSFRRALVARRRRLGIDGL